jgi:hypothetical protein
VNTPIVYQVKSLTEAASTAIPPMWVTPEGIQNAAYLFNSFYSVVSGATGTSGKELGAALSLAMYKALYDSTDFGEVNRTSASNFKFIGASAHAKAAYKDFLDALAGFDGTQLQENGIAVPRVLVYGQQQEFLIPVPEASTVMAASAALALALLGLGARSKNSRVVHIGNP